MNIQVKGLPSVYDFEHLARVFFPGAAVRRIPSTRGLLVYARAGKRRLAVALRTENRLECRLLPYGSAEKTKQNLKNSNNSDDILNTRTTDTEANAIHADAAERLKTQLARLLYDLLVEATGFRPPWGMLTGVRPLRLFRRGLLQGGAQGARRLLVEQCDVSPNKYHLLESIAENQDALLSAAAGPGRALAFKETTSLNKTDTINIIDAEKYNYKQKNILSKAEKHYSLYVSIPFCPSRCAYCSFVSQSIEKDHNLIDSYLDKLDEEMANTAALAEQLGLTLRSVYVGGGTPTALPAPALARFLHSLQVHFAPRHCPEYTVEAGRPDCTSPEKLQLLKSYGVGRISINPQSMHNAVLRAIGRRHSSTDVRRCFADARAAGHANINMDIIAGLPSDNEAGFAQTLAQVLALAPESITLHNLTLKRASNLVMAGETQATNPAAMLESAYPQLLASGYQPYYLYRQKSRAQSHENTGWAKPGAACLYNVYIMEELHSILAVGAGASTKLVGRGGSVIRRYFNPKYPAEYLREFSKVIRNKEGVKAFYAGNLDTQTSG